MVHLSDVSRHNAGDSLSKILVDARRRVVSNCYPVYQCDRSIIETGQPNKNGVRDACPISIQGKTYDKGLGTAVPFVFTYDLAGRYSELALIAGADDWSESPEDWVLHVYLDGVEAGCWPVAADRSTAIQVDTSGAMELVLLGLGPKGTKVVLADARLTEAPEPAKPARGDPLSRRVMFELDDELIVDCEVLLMARTAKKIDSETGPDETAAGLGGYGRTTASRGADMWTGIRDKGDLLRWQALIRRPGKYHAWVRVVAATAGEKPDPGDYLVRVDGQVLSCRLAPQMILTRMTGERFTGHLWGYLCADIDLDAGLRDVEVTNASGAWVAVDRVVLVREGPVAKQLVPQEACKPIAASRDMGPSLRWEPKKLLGRHFVASDGGEPFVRARDLGLMFAPDLTHFMPVFGTDLANEGKPDEAFLSKILASDLPFTIHVRFNVPRESPIVDADTYRRIRRLAGDRWQGFWTTEWSDNYVFSPAASAVPKPTTRKEAYERVRAWYKQNVSNCYDDIMAMCTGWAWDHYAGEWSGVTGFQDEPGPSPEGPMRILFPRGAARQYGKFWHSYIAPGTHDAHVTMTQNGYLTSPTRPHDTRMNPEGGASLSWIRRMMYLVYMWGASSFKNETPAYETDMTSDGRTALSPMGEVAAEFFQFVATHRDRGICCTPVGFMLDRMHGWGGRPMYPDNYPPLTWVCLQPEPGDYMKEAIFQMLYPGQCDVLNEWNALTPTPYGDLFDVMLSTATLDHVLAYPVLLLVGDLAEDMNDDLVSVLQAYVRQGGTLVISESQLASPFPRDMLGVRLTDVTDEGSSAKCDLDGQQMTGGAFRLRVVECTTAETIMSTPSGAPLVTRNCFGAGAVVFSTVPFLLQENLNGVCFLPHLFEHLTSGLLPFTVTGDVEYAVNRNEDSWLITLLNNRGVYKLPPDPASIDPRQAQTVCITLATEPAAAADWITAESLTASHVAGGWQLTVDIPPGDLRILQVKD